MASNKRAKSIQFIYILKEDTQDYKNMWFLKDRIFQEKSTVWGEVLPEENVELKQKKNDAAIDYFKTK